MPEVELTPSLINIPGIPSARGRAEQQLYLQAIVAYMEDVVLITEGWPIDQGGPRVVYVNDAFTRMTGYQPDEILGKTPRLLQGHGTSPETRAFIRERLQSGMGFTCELLNYKRDGTPFWVMLSVQPALDATGEWTHWVAVQRDITRSKNEQAARDAALTTLRETERRLLTAQAVARIGSWEVDVDTGVISWSPETFRLFQFDPTKGEPDFETLQMRCHPDDRAGYVAAIERTIREPTPYEFNLRVVLDDGTIRWLRATGKPDQAHDGTVKRFFGVVQDITERKITSDALRASEQQYRQIVETASEGILMTDATGTITFVNSEMVKMTGYTLEEMIGKNTTFFVPEESVPTIKAGFARRRRGLSDQYEIQVRHRETGNFWVTISASPILSPAGDFAGTLGMLTDISDQKRQEAALRESESRFRSTFDDAAIGMTINTVDGTRLQVNDAFCLFLGVPREEIVGTSNLDWVNPMSAALKNALRERCLSGELRYYRVQVCYHHSDGRTVWGDLTASLVRDSATGQPLYFISQIADITDRKRLEQQLVQREKLAAVGQLVAGVAHEINNPLAVISGHAQLLALHPDPQIRADAATIRDMAERASGIVRSLRSHARHGEISPESRHHFTDLNGVVNSALPVIQYRLRDLTVTLETDLAADLAPVPMNAGEIEQVIVNLLSNAADALQDTPPDRRVIRIRTWDTGPEDTGDSTCAAGLSITDNGAGMAPEVASRVFDPFFTTKDTDRGTGLGLYISHGIINAHGGTIRAESREGTGTTFTICLPYGVAPDSE